MRNTADFSTDESSVKVRIDTLGRFAVFIEGAPLRFDRRGQPKPLELLKVLIACGGENVPQDRLADALWPQADGDAALASFTTTLHRLRRMIGADALLLRNRALSLGPSNCRVDAIEFTALVEQARKALAAGDRSLAKQHLEAVVALYRGPFLVGEFDPEEIPAARERMNVTFLQQVRELARIHSEQGDVESALAVYQRGLAVDEVAEDLYEGLMASCLAAGRMAEGMAVYRRCKAVLRETLHTEPSARLQETYELLRANAPPTGTASPSPAAELSTASATSRQPPRKRPLALAMASVLAVVVVAGAWQGYQRWSTDRAPMEAEREAALPLPDKPSIAVLPFANLSENADDQWFSDGLAESITTDLAKLKGLFVIARNSAFTYRERSMDVRRIGAELGVRYVLEGSVQKTPRRLRINAQLVDAVTGRHVWAERFDRPVVDSLTVQDEITRAIVLHLSVELGEGEAARLRLKDTANLRVYELYMRARSLWLSNYTCDALREVFALHEQARELDSGSYLPYTGLSAAHGAAVVFGCTRSPVESLNQAIAMAERAIALNPWNSFALSLRGWQHLLLREYDEAVKTLQRAIVASPNDADSYAYYGWALVYVGRHEEAREAMQKAMHLHPYYPAWYPCAAGLASFWLGRPDEGIEDMMLGFERAPNNLTRLAYLAAVHSAAGNLQQARHWAHEVLRVKPDFSAGAWVATTQPYQDPADAARVLALLQEAGLPD